MTVVLFVLMLSIPVFMVARSNKFTFALIAIWGFFLGLTPAGPGIHQLLTSAGASILGIVS